MPNSVLDDNVYIKGTIQHRRRVVLNTGGCKVPSCSMCSLTHENKPMSQSPVNQLKSCLATDDDIAVLTLYNNGNFFLDKEISPESRIALYSYLATTKVKLVIVESLPQFITPAKIQEAQQYLEGKILQVNIGLQCWDDDLRRDSIKSTCLVQDFLKAHETLAQAGYQTGVFVLYGIPYESELIADISLWNTLYKLAALKPALASIMLCPLKPSQDTPFGKWSKSHSSFVPSIEKVAQLCASLDRLQQDNIFISTNLLAYSESMPSEQAEGRQKAIARINKFNTKVASHA